MLGVYIYKKLMCCYSLLGQIYLAGQYTFENKNEKHYSLHSIQDIYKAANNDLEYNIEYKSRHSLILNIILLLNFNNCFIFLFS